MSTNNYISVPYVFTDVVNDPLRTPTKRLTVHPVSDAFKLDYDLNTVLPKTFTINETGMNWTNGTLTFNTPLEKIGALATGLPAVQEPPNTSTLSINNTLLLDAGTDDTTTIDNKNVVVDTLLDNDPTVNYTQKMGKFPNQHVPTVNDFGVFVGVDYIGGNNKISTLITESQIVYESTNEGGFAGSTKDVIDVANAYSANGGFVDINSNQTIVGVKTFPDIKIEDSATLDYSEITPTQMIVGNNGSPTVLGNIQNIIFAGNLQQTQGLMTLTGAETASGEKTFTGQTVFESHAPHCDTLATQYNDLVTKAYVDSVVGSNSGSGLLLYLDQSMNSDITGYKVLTTQYYFGEPTQYVTIPSDGTNIISSFMSVSGFPNNYGNVISAGLFNMNLFAYVSANTGIVNTFFTINKYDTITSSTTLLATSGNSGDINSVDVPTSYFMSCSFPETPFLSSDRLLIILYETGSGTGSRTITACFEGSYYSYVNTPISQGSSSLTSNNVWTGTNNFTNTTTAPTALVNTNDTTVANCAYVQNNLIPYLKSSDASITYAPITNPTFLGNVSLPTTSCDTINASSSGVTMNIGTNLASAGIMRLGSTTATQQALLGTWDVTTALRTSTISYPTASTAINLYTTSTNTSNNIGGGTLAGWNFNTNGGGVTRLGSTGNTQIGTSTSAVFTSNNVNQITNTNNVSLYVNTTGTLTIGGASGGTCSINTPTTAVKALTTTGLITAGTNIALSTTLPSASTQLGYTVNSNTVQTTGTQTLAGTYTVFASGTGATLTQLSQGVYLFCANCSFILAGGIGGSNTVTVNVVSNTSNTTVGITVYKTLMNPLIGYPTTVATTATYPYSCSQAVVIDATNANKWFTMTGTFTVVSPYTAGNAKMIIDSYSITRIG